MQLLRHIFTLYHSDQGVGGGAPPPDPGSAGGAGPAQPGTVPPGDQGQQGNEAFWNAFPNVPQEHRALLEPHLRQAMGHVTQLEQQLAPLRPLIESGVDPQNLQGLVAFSQNFDRDPLQVWLDMGQMLQKQAGQNGRTVVDPEVDLEYLAALARGEDPEAGQVPGGPPGAPGPQGDQTTDGWSPRELALYQAVQELQGQVGQLTTGFQQDQTQRQEQVYNQLHQKQLGKMRAALVSAGYEEDQLGDEVLNAHVLTARGDFARATQQLVDHRTSILRGLATTRTQEPEPTNLPNGGPPSPGRQKPRQGGDPFKDGRRNAEARLKRLNAPG